MKSWGVWILPILLAAFVLLPILEITLIIRTGQAIGLLPTVLLLVATSALGAVLARREGTRAWDALRSSFTSGRMPTGELADAALVLSGSILLIVPGFVTDVVGLLFLLPFTRPLARGLIGWLAARTAKKQGIDLDQLRRQAPLGGAAGATVIKGETVETPAEPQVVVRPELDR